MPPNTRGQQKPSNQRRTFRGRGGPSDGNLPPKKTPRVKVKYQHHQASAAAAPDTAELEEEHAAGIIGINQLSLEEDNGGRINNDDNHDTDSGKEEQQEEGCNNPLQKEINHLQTKIQNITHSIQSSPLGISSPNTWRTNCLHPIKNVVKEWRSILLFHSQEIDKGGGGGGSEEQVVVVVSDENSMVVQSSSSNNDSSIEATTELQQLLQETSTKVFILIQMAMQTGPLVGSNPGYFKRCGGEVALVALEFLMNVIDLAGGITDAAVADDDDDDNNEEEEDHSDQGGNDSSDNVDAEKGNDSLDLGADSNIDESSSSSSTNDDDESENDKTATVAPETSAASPSTQIKEEMQMIQTALQDSFLFTEKQSLRVHQWYRNVTKAAETKNATPKRAEELQI